jgi:hypothetical protein
MGFYWSVEMQVAFVQPVTIPGEVSWSRTLGALQKFDGGGSLFAAAAQALPAGSGVPETVAKRARTARSVMVTAADASDDEDPYEGNFEVLYNAGPDAFMSAGSAAVEKILGAESGISLVLMHASESCGGSADDTELVLIHEPTAVKPAGKSAGDGRGSANCPFGISMTAIPSEVPAQTADQMRRVLRALGMDAKGEPGWRLITSTSGG